MPTFGFAAFLKIASLNPKPQKTELRKRLLGDGGGYDFHRSLKLASKRLIVERAPLEGLLVSAEDVVKIPERKSLIAGLTKLGLWRDGISGDAYQVPGRVYESPRGLFKIASQPEFGLLNGDRRIAFHLWNTKRPDLQSEEVYSALAILPSIYPDDGTGPTDFGVLSLHEPKAYLLSDRIVSPLSINRSMRSIEEVMLKIYEEEGRVPVGIEDQRPRA
jgi:hypothetical protein